MSDNGMVVVQTTQVDGGRLKRAFFRAKPTGTVFDGLPGDPMIEVTMRQGPDTGEIRMFPASHMRAIV